MMKQLIKFFISILFLFPLIFIPSEESFSQMPQTPAIYIPKPDFDVSIYKYKWLDIAYANESKAQKLDIYLPDNRKKYPLIIAIHGGGWELGDKRNGEVAPILQSIKRGYAVASINYRLSDEAKFPAQIYDVKAAIRYLRANADKYKLIPTKFTLWGYSAGEHLAALAGTSGDIAEVEDLNMGNKEQSSRVQAVITWFGGFALQKALKFPAIAKLFDPGVEETSDIVRKSLPATYISKDDPPFFIEHGNKDRGFLDSIYFAGALQKVSGKEKVKLKIIEGAGHGDPLFETEENINEMLEFLDNALSGKLSDIVNTDKQTTQISSLEAETKGRTLLNDLFKALSGRKALAAINTLKITKQINQGGMYISQTVTIEYPEKVHIVTNTPGGEITTAITKEDAWVKPPYQAVIPIPKFEANDIRRSILRDIRNLAVNFQRLKVQYVGQQIVNGKSLDDIQIIQNDDSFHLLIDPATKLTSRIIYTDMGRPCGPMDITEDLFEYKTINNIQWATKGAGIIAG